MAKFTATIKEIDHGWKAIRRFSARDARGAYVKAGLLESKAQREEGGPSNAEVGAWNEFGVPSKNIPERSFIRSTFEAHKAEYQKMLSTLLGGYFTGKMTLDRALGLVGLKMASDQKRAIVKGIPPPNAPSTLARKEKKTGRGSVGPPKPLIDTGQMLNAISSEVVLGKGEK